MICSVLDKIMKKINHIRLGSSNDIVLYHPNSKFYFIPIPKNASSFLYECFSQIDWEYYKLYYYEQLKDKIPIVIYRDPVERWFSGFAQDYTPEKFPNGIHDKEVAADFFKQGFYGIHTLSQQWYIHKFKTYNGIFIKFSKPYTNLINILKDNIENINKIVVNPHHGSAKDYRVEQIIREHYYSDPVNQENLKIYLNDDLEFYNTINFIDGTKTLQNYKFWDSYKRIESI